MEWGRLAEDAERAVADVLSGRAAGLAVATSGSTGAPREVLLPREAITASARATEQALGGPGAWLLALPSDRIAGAMVIARAMLADAPLVRMASGPFTPAAFADAAARLPGDGRRCVSLVPTQLHRLLESATGRDALACFDAVLVGGAALRRADVPPNVVVTYGATETCGGCVYDGSPLPGTRVEIVDGLIRIAGPSLAIGYSDGEDSRLPVVGGTRWFLTSDLGEVVDGRLRVLGRADDVIVTGGVKVAPAPVEEAVAALPWVEEAIVVGVPDAEWGEAVVAVVALAPGGAPAPWSSVREQLAATLPRTHVPRAAVIADVLPRLESGKIDRAKARALAAQAVAERGEPWPT